MEIEGHHVILNENEEQNEIETNLWIPLSSDIYSHNPLNPWCTSFVMVPGGPPFYYYFEKWVNQGTGAKGL